MFDFIKDNGIEMSKYSKTDHLRDVFNSYGSEIFSADQQINRISGNIQTAEMASE